MVVAAKAIHVTQENPAEHGAV